MVLMMKKFFLLLALLAAPLSVWAQDTPGHGGIPDDVYYLMPSFGDGYVYFRGQMPAQGKLNICALDQTLRFIDNDGKELQASDPENILKVVIGTVSFLHHEDIFYRMYPLSADMGVAVERKVHIIRGAKEGAYGASTQTSSVKQYGAIVSDGYMYKLGSEKVPYEMTETVCIYKGQSVLPVSKKNLRKLFPDRKAEIDAWFKAGNALPRDVEGVMAFLQMWYQ